ncbi:MAG: TraR/DksA C4-type zinc finger protein [Nitrospirae bacterium]|nr:TraR/DksA C4-type zinc finger protein [Nitrospirota bacterium]
MKSLRDVSRFHGHMCPGLALGYRVSEFALRKLGTRAKDEEIVAVVENDSCAVDAIQVMTGCTFGKGNLIFKDYGKQVYTFIQRGIRKPKVNALRISVKWQSPEETPIETSMWQRYMKGQRTPVVLKAVHKRKSKKINAILNAKDRELFDVRVKKIKPPLEAHIWVSIPCSVCGEKVMETRARIKEGKVMCIPCLERDR